MSVESIIDAAANCVFPEDIMLCILTRLPVKSLVRFKCVCTPWRELFADPRFKKLHYNQFSSDRKNQAFLVINGFSGVGKETMSLVSLESDEIDVEPAKLDLPYRVPFEFRLSEMFSVGCFNGLVCMGVIVHHFEVGIKLWNPAMRLSKFVLIPDASFCLIKKIALGFGYDAERDDFRVVTIVTWLQNDRRKTAEVEAGVYSTKSDIWISIELPFQIRELCNGDDIICNNAIVNGNPYWFARINENDQSLTDVLVWCDVTRLEFKIVPLTGLKLEEPAKLPFVNWKGSLAALLYTKSDERLESLDVWVFDDSEMVWRKNQTFGPIEMKVDRCLQCSEYGIIMGDCLDGKLFVLDPETGLVKEFEIGEYQKRYLQINGYSESLVCIEGMEKIELVDEDEEMYSEFEEEMYLEVEEEMEHEEQGNP